MNDQITPGKVGVRYGIIVALASILYSLILYLLGLGQNQALGYLGLLIILVGIVLALKYFKENGDGFMTFGQGFTIASIMVIINSVASTIFTYVYVSMVDASIIQQAKDEAYQNMVEQGLDDAIIEQSMAFINPLIISVSIFFMSLIVGLIVAAIISAVMKKENPAEI